MGWRQPWHLISLIDNSNNNSNPSCSLSFASTVVSLASSVKIIFVNETKCILLLKCTNYIHIKKHLQFICSSYSIFGTARGVKLATMENINLCCYKTNGYNGSKSLKFGS